MKVRDCKIDDEYIKVGPDQDLNSVKNRYCHFIVVIENKKPIGIVTNNDIIRNVKSEEDYKRLKFRDIMSSPVFTVGEDDDMEKVGRLMVEKGFMSLPVVNKKGEFVGLITYFDYLGVIANRLRSVKK
ncbi:MAG: CBS domain-containing protein [Candidatus Aenigmatarchaeota archaeon]